MSVNEDKSIKFQIASGILIIISFILAIFVVNVGHWSKYYTTFVSFPIYFGYGHFIHHSTMINFVNDGLMTLFFLLIGLELKFHLVLGEYKHTKNLVLPTAAAIGGIVVPALIYVFFNFDSATIKGWAIPIATDTAFMLGLLSFFNRSISKNLRAFVISFSLIDDAIALLILALFYTKSPNFIAMNFCFGLLLLLIGLNRAGVKNSAYYLMVGVFLWVAMVESGIHGTLCGAVLALTIPVEHEGRVNPSFDRLEEFLNPVVYFLILPLFIFINSGVHFASLSLPILTSNISKGIICGLFIGKQLGIYSLSYLVVKMRWGALPFNVSWLKFYAICILGGIGFTLSLFIGDLTFELGEPHASMRAAVIIGSLLSAFLGAVVLVYAVKKD